jgi:uncharacterized OB-fold protein
MSSQIPLHEGLFTWPGNPELLASRCDACGEHAFPPQDSCRACTGRETTVVGVGRTGTLWTWTIQSFMPKAPYHTDETPETFVPYGVGYVELPCGLRVESRLRENTPESLKIGMPMELELVPVRRDSEGRELLTFQFRAAAQPDAAEVH